MDRPKIELRKIKLSKHLSDETPAYAAEVWVDGEPFCVASNHGQGGPDEQRPIRAVEPGSFPRLRDALAALEERIKATVPVEKVDLGNGQTFDLQPSFELICHRLVGEHETKQALKHDLKGYVLFVKPGQRGVWQVRVRDRSRLDEAIVAVKQKNGVSVTLNEMPFEDALRVYAREAA